MVRMLFVPLFLVSVAVASAQSTQETHEEAAAVFDGSGAGREIPIGRGLAVVASSDSVASSRIRPAHRWCPPGPGKSFRCRDIPDRLIEEHEVITTYRILDRARYAEAQGKPWIFPGAAAGLGLGLTAGALALLAAGPLSTLLILTGLGAVFGAAAGYVTAWNIAANRSEVFSETEEYTVSRDLPQ
ncbi:MAG: hypothetical protein HYT79_08800 [Elusimicrobia bacterium]|nr:hypothetical protein [Elusimicrobiota bacterium]